MIRSPDRLRKAMRGVVQFLEGESSSFQQGQLQSQRQASTVRESLQTEDGHAQGIEHEPRPHLASVRLGRNPHSSLAIPLEPRQDTIAGATSDLPKSYRAECEDIVRALRRPTSGAVQSPLLALQQQVKDFFQHGPERTTGIFVSILAAAECNETRTLYPDRDVGLSWKSCKASATLVGLLACPPAAFIKVIKFLGYTLGGLDTDIDKIRKTPSDSLRLEFQRAKALALGEKSTTTVISVSLGDICDFELDEQKRSGEFASFAHAFVLGVGPEGVILWQSWGEDGYPLDKWLNDNGARLRNWQEAGYFVDEFETFAAYKVS